MTRAQANQLSVALEGQDIPHSIGFAYDAQGVESASVTLSTAITYTGPQLAALANYCGQHALNLTLIVAELAAT